MESREGEKTVGVEQAESLEGGRIVITVSYFVGVSTVVSPFRYCHGGRCCPR